MCGWLSEARTRASRSKRARRSGSCATSSSRSLSRPRGRAGCRGRDTPRPSRPRRAARGSRSGPGCGRIGASRTRSGSYRLVTCLARVAPGLGTHRHGVPNEIASALRIVRGVARPWPLDDHRDYGSLYVPFIGFAALPVGPRGARCAEGAAAGRTLERAGPAHHRPGAAGLVALEGRPDSAVSRGWNNGAVASELESRGRAHLRVMAVLIRQMQAVTDVLRDQEAAADEDGRGRPVAEA